MKRYLNEMENIPFFTNTFKFGKRKKNIDNMIKLNIMNLLCLHSEIQWSVGILIKNFITFKKTQNSELTLVKL